MDVQGGISSEMNTLEGKQRQMTGQAREEEDCKKCTPPPPIKETPPQAISRDIDILPAPKDALSLKKWRRVGVMPGSVPAILASSGTLLLGSGGRRGS